MTRMTASYFNLHQRALNAPDYPDTDHVDTTIRSGQQLAKIQRAASRAAAFNPEDASLSPFALSQTASDDLTLTNQYRISNNNLLQNIRVTGGLAKIPGANASIYVFPVTTVLPGAAGNLGNFFSGGSFDATTTANVFRISFQVDTAAKLQIRMAGAGAAKFFRVMIDGQYAGSKMPVAFAGGDPNNITLTLDGRPHVITIESSRDVGLAKIMVPSSATITRAPLIEGTIALNTGDSYGEGTGSEYNFLGQFAWNYANRTGIDDMRNVAVGGTGYLQVNNTLGAKHLAVQIPYWTQTNPDLVDANGKMSAVSEVVCAAGVNDYTFSTSAIVAEAQAVWGMIRDLCPNALITVVGPWNGTRLTSDAKLLADENGLKAAHAAWGDPNSFFIPVNTATSPWMPGTGKVGGAVGDGPADFFFANENPRLHVTEAGHNAIAVRMAAAKRSYLATR